MKDIVPALNKTQLKAVLRVAPPGTYYGFINWAGIIVRPIKEAGVPSNGWKEVYIPYSYASDAYTTLHEMESVFNAIERVWGEIGRDGAKGMIKFRGKDCFYLCFKPKTSRDFTRT